MHLKRSNIWKCIWAISKNTAGQHLTAEKHLKIHFSIIRNYSWVTSEQNNCAYEESMERSSSATWADTSEKEQHGRADARLSAQSMFWQRPVLLRQITSSNIFVGYWSICQNLNIIFVGYRSICQNLNIFSNTKRKVSEMFGAFPHLYRQGKHHS